MCVFLRFTSRRAPGQTSQRVSRDILREVGEEKDIHLSLSPEPVHKEARCLLTPGRCLSCHQPRRLCHLAWLLAPGSETSGQPKHHRAGGTVCAVCLRPSPAVCSFPPRALARRLRRTVWLGPAVACPLGIRSSTYPAYGAALD